MRDRYISESEVTSIFETALKNGEFAVFYQPVVNAQTGKIVSAEALVRWRYKGVDLYFPGTFIPALEKNGQISQLDFFVMKEVRRFQEQRHLAGKRIVPVSINLSWMDFYDTEMINWVLRDIEKSFIFVHFCIRNGAGLFKICFFI